MIQSSLIKAAATTFLLLPFPALSGELARLQVTTADATYRVAVSQSDETGLNRTLTIECINRCDNFSSYKEKVDALPLGLIRLTDAYPLVISTWAEGTSTKIHIYKLSRDGVKLVFDQYTLGTPSISPKGGVLSLSVLQYAGGGAGSHRKVVAKTWTWKNEGFVPTTG